MARWHQEQEEHPQSLPRAVRSAGMAGREEKNEQKRRREIKTRSWCLVRGGEDPGAVRSWAQPQLAPLPAQGGRWRSAASPQLLGVQLLVRKRVAVVAGLVKGWGKEGKRQGTASWLRGWVSGFAATLVLWVLSQQIRVVSRENRQRSGKKCLAALLVAFEVV